MQALQDTGRYHHLAAINADVWPAIVTIPTGMFVASKARRAEAEFATACEKAGLDLDGPHPDLRVLYEEVFTRIAYSGWLGLAEGYMAGEWESDNLVRVLTGLLEVGYRPRCGKLEVGGLYLGEEIPDSLVRLYSGDGMSTHGPVFSSGVPTTERVYMKSYVPGAGKKDEPGQHFVDITELSPPTLVERADLGDAQVRAAVGLLDSAHVGIGTHVLDFPSSGPTIPIAAARRSATVDVLSSDAQQVADVQDVVAMADVDSSVQVRLLESLFPNPRTWPSHYDVITSVEKLEVMDTQAQRVYAQSLNRMLVHGGFLAVQTVVATDKLSVTLDRCADVLRAYIWPALNYLTIEQLHRLFDVNTDLRIIAQTHMGSHYVEGLAMQRETFEAQSREAAANGYDRVYRNLWVFQLALREALFRVGALDALQLVVTSRYRRAWG